MIKGFCLFCLGLFFLGTSHAAIINFSGALEFVETNDGSGVFSSTSIGTTFFGNFTYGDSESDAFFAGGGDFRFLSPPFVGNISDGISNVQSFAGEEIEIGIGNDVPLGEDFLLVNNLLGTSFDATAQFDIWDIEGQDDVAGGGRIEFAIGFLFDTSIYNAVEFRVAPPDAADIELSFFAVREFDEFDNETYFGYGKLHSVSAIPIPAAVWLFGTALLGLVGFSKRRKAA